MDANEIELKDEERQPVECWSRCMGYFRPVSEWNRGKKSEFAERKCFTEEKTISKMEKTTKESE